MLTTGANATDEQGGIDVRHHEPLLEAGALQHAIFNSANFSSIATDANGVIQIFNVGAERMLGYAATEVVNKITPAAISDPQEVILRARSLTVELGTPITPGFEALVFKASRGIEDIYELTYIRKDGSRFPAMVSVTALRDPEGAIIGYLLIGTDNTARKLVEAEREKLDQRLRDQQFYTRSLIESNINAMMATDPRGIITDVNRQTEALTGCTRDELIGSPFKNYFTEPDRADDGIRRVLAEGALRNYELTARARNGTLTVVSYNATTFYDRDRRLQGVFAAARDVTDLKRTARSLKQKNVELEDTSRRKSESLTTLSHDLVESERLYRSTFDAAPVGIVHVSLDGRWLRVNQRLCDLLGYSCDELQGRGVGASVQLEDADGEAEALDRMAAGTLDHHVVDEKRYRRRDGSVVWARVNMAVHRDADGQSQHFIMVIEDITDRRMLEAQVRQANKMDAIGKLASGVAHDFNNLLTVIIGFGELITAAVPPDDQNRKDLDEMMKAARRATGLTKQLLAFSRQQVLHTAPLDVNQLIADMAGMLGRLIGDHIAVTLTLDPELSLALVDRSQLEQVVMNLVVNARDAMSGGGTLTIETTDIDLENSSFHEETVMQGRYVMLAITDSGGGMTREIQRRVFEPFFTTKETGKGTGLGLSTTYGIVKQSKGYIWVYSELGRGTTFKVYLPRSTREEPMPPAGGVVRRSRDSASATVLLVEDEPSVRELSKRILDNAGYRVLEAANGDEAERVYAAHADAIDLVVTDVIMPGCGGPELMARLQVHAPALRVLYMSGYTEQAAARTTGIDRGLPFVQKPFTAAEFERQVRDALNR
jgi:PAS domain S-box-containing protein